MNFKLLLLSIVTFLTSIPLLNAQQIELKEFLDRFDQSLNSIHSVVYQVNHQNKYLARKDTVNTTAICSLFVVRKDKMKSFHHIDMLNSEKNTNYFIQRKYDGKKSLFRLENVENLTLEEKVEIFSDKKMVHSTVNNYRDLLFPKYFGVKNEFKAYGTKLMKAFFKDIFITEEIFENTPVYVLNFHYKDEKRDTTRDHVTKHYVRKSDFLPIGFYSFLRWENMEQYNFYTIKYIEINPSFSVEDFEIKDNETIDAIQLYQNFNNQLKR